jgi:peptidoglycan/xylan/chitin deacetylase (PgdA/CDA1 family)
MNSGAMRTSEETSPGRAGFRTEAAEPTWPTVVAALTLAAGGASLAALSLSRKRRAVLPAAFAGGLAAASWLSPHWPGVIRRIPAGPRVALTFDDGPHPDTTPAILDALAAAGARATFFVLGRSAFSAPDLVRRMVSEGHTVGIHGWDHRPLTLSAPRRLRRELNASRKAVEDATGASVRWFRPPYGYRGPSLARVLREEGLITVGWRFAARDWASRTADEVCRHVLSRIRRSDVVLLHDAGPGARLTVEALPRILAGLEERGLRAVTLDEGLPRPDTKEGVP